MNKNQFVILAVLLIAMPSCLFMMIDGCVSSSPANNALGGDSDPLNPFAEAHQDILDDLKRGHSQDMLEMQTYYEMGGFE